jgi:hypothetical protein
MVTPTDEMLAGSGPLSDQPFGLAVFDLDGTLLRGPTVCEVLAQALGRLDHMKQLEALIAGLSDIDITAAREEMARWYQDSQHGVGDRNQRYGGSPVSLNSLALQRMGAL